MDFQIELEYIADKLGEVPRQFNIFQRMSYLRLSMPLWDWRKDDISKTITNWDKTIKHGKLAWGHIIQVNSLLFYEGKDNCPGEMLVCTDNLPHIPKLLSEISHELYLLKGKSNQLKGSDNIEFAKYLEDELIRVYGMKVPSIISDKANCFISTVYFQRNHLPTKIIDNSLFPVLYLDADPKVVVPVPYQFWSKVFKEGWIYSDFD